MEVCSVKSFYIKSKVNEHKNIKKHLLKLIADYKVSKNVDDYKNISKINYAPDTSLQELADDNYLTYLWPYVKDKISEVAKFLKAQNLYITNAWFQQYRKNDIHDWHSHFGCLLHCVYFLELPDPKYATQIQTYDGKVIQPKVKEGDLLFLLTPNRHRSPINKSSKRKTIIAFNMNMIKTQDLPKGNKWETSIYE